MDIVELEKRVVTGLPDGWKLGQIKAEHPATRNVRNFQVGRGVAKAITYYALSLFESSLLLSKSDDRSFFLRSIMRVIHEKYVLIITARIVTTAGSKKSKPRKLLQYH